MSDPTPQPSFSCDSRPESTSTAAFGHLCSRWWGVGGSVEAKDKDDARPPVGDLDHHHQGIRTRPDACIFSWRIRAWRRQMAGFGGLVNRLNPGLTVSCGHPEPEVRAPGLRAWCFLHACQMPPHEVWLFSFPSSSQDPS